MWFYDADFGMGVTNTVNDIVNAFLEWKENNPHEDSTELEAKLAKAIWELHKVDNQIFLLDDELKDLLNELKGNSDDT